MRTILVAAALAASAGGCARPLQQPLLALAGRVCDPRPSFAAAIPITADRAGTGVLGAEGPCLAVEGGPSTTYAAFALPGGEGPYNLEITSLVVPMTIVRPRVTLYDADARALRTIEPSEFEQNIVGLRTGVRATGSERWLVVTADQAMLGQHFEVRLGGGDGRYQLAAAVPVIIIVPTVAMEPPRANGGIYSLNGSILVSATKPRMAN